MDMPCWVSAIKRTLRARPSLFLLLAFVILLGAANVLIVNQRVTLYLFYVPVIAGAWYLPRRDAAGVAILAAALVFAYIFFLPTKMGSGTGSQFVWAELTVWGGILVVTAYMVGTLRASIARAMWDLQQAYQGVLEILSKFIQTVDTDTANHSVRVSALSVRIAQAMNLDRQSIEEARVAGLLHDVGKVEVSIGLLRKSAALSADEKAAVGKHVAGGAAMVACVGGMLGRVADAVECHHEKFDGSGLKGLKGQSIPQVARIIAAADAFDAMISDRPYRKGISVFDARDSIMAVSGVDFDPKVIQALHQVIDNEGEAATSPLTTVEPMALAGSRN
jgi:putative nucleotidyltransferase with HDIG domain